jgi:LPXTG-motif cell wall-anchored protein
VILAASAVAAVVVGLAGPASAHTADATVSQTCVNGTSQSTVHFNNNFDVPATLSYRGPASGSLPLPPMIGASPGTNSVTLAVESPITLTYRVRWDDGVTQGDRSVALEPIHDCLPASTTTVPAVSVVPTSPPTTAPPPPPKVEVLPTTVERPPDTPSLVAVPAPAGAPAANPAPSAAPSQLPATGADSSGFLVGGTILIVAGALMIAGGRWAERR